MKIIRPYAKIIGPEPGINSTGLREMRHIEWCARISHGSEEAQSPDSWQRFIPSVVIDHGDWSVVEHVSVSVDAIVDRGITHEWVRHRLFGFTQSSTRFINYVKKMPPSFIYPKPDVECARCLTGGEPDWENRTRRWEHADGAACAYDENWISAITWAESEYIALIKKGWRPQEARSVFPNALASRIVTTGNLRNWRHFFLMRTTAEAHPQMRQVTIPLLAEFKAVFPILYDDIEPNARQVENLRKPR